MSRRMFKVAIQRGREALELAAFNVFKRDFIVNYGIDAGRISTVSYGETRPADPGHDEGAWAKNRRVDVVIQ